MEENKLKFNLQFFAEEGNEKGEKGDNDGDEKNEANKNEGNKELEITFTPEQQKKVDEIIERRVAQEKRKADEYAKEKADEAARLAKMNKDQKAEYEREQMEKELEQLRSEKQLNEMRSEARAILLSNEIDARDEVVSLVVADTAEKTKENIEAFSAIIQKSVEDAIKANARQAVPKNGDSFNGGNSSNVYDNFAEIAKQARIIKN